MKEKLIDSILAFGKNIPRHELEDLDIESLEFILKLRQETAEEDKKAK